MALNLALSRLSILTLMLRIFSFFNAAICSPINVALVVMEISSSPSAPVNRCKKSISPFLTKGSPPVILIFFIPSSINAVASKNISFQDKSSFEVENKTPPSGIQYWQRMLQLSVTDSRK